MSFTTSDGREWETTEEGDLKDGARVEMGLVGPWWSPIMRFRFYMDHTKPQDHMTVWKVRWVSKYLGSYTPPGWFLKLIGQVKP